MLASALNRPHIIQYMDQTSEEPAGLSVILDKLVYSHDPETLPAETPHAFIYFLTIQNLSERTVTLLGRKWIIDYDDGRTQVIEGDKIVGKTPTLATGESFSYNSYHVSGQSCRASGGFHGLDSEGQRIHVKIPEFEMNIPEDTPNIT